MARYIDLNNKEIFPESINGMSFEDGVKIFEKYIGETEFSGEEYNGMRCMRDYLEWYRDEILNANTADVVEVVHAEWIGKYLGYGQTIQKCSNCGQRVNIDTFEYISKNFCSNCGAKMSGQKKEENNG